MPQALNIVFVCTGNACRSQMAEGFARRLGGDAVRAASAGIEAHGKNPLAVEVMAQAGVDISDQASKRLSDDLLASADLVVTVCGHADEHCPLLPPGVRRIHWPLADPARATGSEDEVVEVFRATRDDIRRRVEQLLAEELETGFQ